MLISRYICIFMFYSFVGWMWDVFFESCMTKKLENRGFLYGPICPIYGVGVLFGFLLCYWMEKYDIDIAVWKLFVISVLVSVILEYVTSHILEELFHATWWDYSELPLNFKGRISLFTSLGFGLGGLFVIYQVVPITLEVCKNIPFVAFEIAAFVVVFMFAMDFALTVTALYHFDRFIVSLNDGVNERFDGVYRGVASKGVAVKNGVKSRQILIAEKFRSMDKFSRSAVRGIQKLSYRHVRSDDINCYIDDMEINDIEEKEK